MTAQESNDVRLREALSLRAARNFTEGLRSGERATTTLLSSSCIPDAELSVLYQTAAAELNLNVQQPSQSPDAAEADQAIDGDAPDDPGSDDEEATGCVPVTRVIQLFRRDKIKPVTRRDQAKCVSICAWSCSIIGMLGALVFLFSEFLDSQGSPAMTSRLVDASTLDLPAISFCLAVPSLPAFEMFPQGPYKGTALFGARVFKNTLDGGVLRWPETHTNGTVRPVVLGPNGTCTDELNVFSFGQIYKAMSNLKKSKNCHSCFQISSDMPIAIPKLNFTKRSRGVVQVEFSVAREIAFCTSTKISVVDYIRRNLMVAVKQNGPALVERGVLLLSGTDDISFALDNAFNQLRRRQYRRYQAELGTFLCNVYFASGFFYPKPRNVDIVYQYSIETDFWAAVGKGPYHRLEAFGADTVAGPGAGGLKADSETITSKLNLIDTLMVFAHDPGTGLVPDYTDSIGVLGGNEKKTYLFSKRLDVKKVGYSTETRSGPQILDIVRERFRIFTSAFDFRHFSIDVESPQSSMSVMELITNIFEYSGLFTGVCVYSVLVGPARFYLRRNNARRQNLNNAPTAG